MHGDFVIIHHTAAAAQEILRALAKAQGITNLYDELMKMVKEEKVQEVKKRLRAAQNFFKHADRDTTDQIKFNPEQSTLILLDAVSLYQSITGELTPPMAAYRLWYLMKHKELLTSEEIKQSLLNANHGLSPERRGEFLEAALEFERQGLA